MRIGGFRFSWLQRRWWLVVASVVGVTLVALLASRPGPVVYSAQAVLVVRSGATTNTPGSANEANRLAVTYSQLIPLDIGVLDRVARTLNVPLDEVEGKVTVVNDANTSILRVNFESSSSSRAIDGAKAVANALVGPDTASQNFNGLAISRLPTTAQRGDSPLDVIPPALALGLMLGLVLVVALERSRGRIEDESDLESLVTCPVTDLEKLNPAGIGALMQRWQTMADGERNAVALVAASDGYRSLTTEIASVFAATAESGKADSSAANLVLVSGGAPGSWEAGERIVQQADIAVVVVPQDMAAEDLRRALKIMKGFGVEPAWALFAGERITSRAKRRHGNGEPLVVEVGAGSPPAVTS